MEIFKLPDELKLANYAMNEEGELYKVGKDESLKEMSLSKDGRYLVTNDDKRRVKISKKLLDYEIMRMNGEFSDRRRLTTPFERYEVNRSGEVFNIMDPFTPISSSDTGVVSLYVGKTNYHKVSRIELVARYFVYEKYEIQDLFNWFLVTDLYKGVKLTTNSRDISGAIYLSKKNVVMCPNSMIGKVLRTIKGLGGHVVDMQSGEAILPLKDKFIILEHFIDNVQGESTKVYKTKRKNFATGDMEIHHFRLSMKDNFVIATFIKKIKGTWFTQDV